MKEDLQKEISTSQTFIHFNRQCLKGGKSSDGFDMMMMMTIFWSTTA